MSEIKSALKDWLLAAWLMINPKYREYLVFAALGIFSAFSFIWPFSSEFENRRFYPSASGCILGVMFIFAFGAFFERIYREYTKKSTTVLLLHGFVYWLFYFMGALYWLVYPLTIDLSLHWMLIPFALIAVPAYLSIPLLLPIYVAKKFCKSVWVSALVFSVLTFIVMYLQGHYAPGFPWALPGYVWSRDVFCIQALSIWGIYGQTLFTLLIGSLAGICELDRRIRNEFSKGEDLSEKVLFKKLSEKGLDKHKISAGVVIVSLISLIVFGYVRVPGMNRFVSHDSSDYTAHKVRCVQGSILQKNKMNRNLSVRNLNLYLNLSQVESSRGNWTPDFVIWPEASIPYLFTNKSETLIKTLSSIVPHNGYLLVGAVRKDSVSGYVHNSVVVLDEYGKNVVNYDKKRLVPFGEYIPFRRFIPEVFSPIANSIGDFAVGKNSNVIDLKGLKIALTVCYEAIFPGEFIPRDSDVDVIINITNDAWFGHTSELVQHLNIVRARAIEEGVPLIRVTNFGISAIFDAYGRKVGSLRTDEVGIMDCYIPKKIEKTFFRKFFVDKIKLKQ